MNKSIILMLVVLAVLIAGCSQQNTQTSAAQQNQTVAAAKTAQAGGNVNMGVTQPGPATVSVLIRNFAFNPASLTIDKGTIVNWTNEDSAAHQIKSDSFNSNQLGKGASFAFKFDKSGTYAYSCAIHPSMKGTINVR